MIMTPAEADLVCACNDIETARADLATALARRERALVRLHVEDGVRKGDVGEHARTLATSAGFATAGLSDGNVRLVLDRPRVPSGS